MRIGIKPKHITLIIFGLLLLALLFNYLWIKNYKHHPPMLMSVKNYNELYLKEAQKWQKDAYLNQISYDFQAGYAGDVSLLFLSKNLKTRALSITIRESGYIDFFRYTIGRSTKSKRHLLDDITIDAEEAMFIFYKDEMVQLSLKNGRPREIVLMYFNNTCTKPVWEFGGFVIDPITKKVWLYEEFLESTEYDNVCAGL